MKHALLFCLLVTHSQRAAPWEMEPVIQFLSQHNPVLAVQSRIVQSLHANATRPTEYMSLDFAGSPTRTPVITPFDQQQMIMQQATSIKLKQEMLSQIIQDLGQLRIIEAGLHETLSRIRFLDDQLAWLTERQHAGHNVMDRIWDITAQLQMQQSLHQKQQMLADHWRHVLAQYAAIQWRALLAYLEGRAPSPSASHP